MTLAARSLGKPNIPLESDGMAILSALISDAFLRLFSNLDRLVLFSQYYVLMTASPSFSASFFSPPVQTGLTT